MQLLQERWGYTLQYIADRIGQNIRHVFQIGQYPTLHAPRPFYANKLCHHFNSRIFALRNSVPKDVVQNHLVGIASLLQDTRAPRSLCVEGWLAKAGWKTIARVTMLDHLRFALLYIPYTLDTFSTFLQIYSTSKVTRICYIYLHSCLLMFLSLSFLNFKINNDIG